jgi:uncharacterized YigZ family protein
MDYLSIAERAQSELVIKRSKFIALAAPVTTHEEAARLLAGIKAAHPGATHNCYAYILPPPVGEARFSDDREPQNTAGKPILSVLQGKGLMGAIVVVTRYFGGVKLGAGGLAQAYRSSAEEALSAGRIVQMRQSIIASVELEYVEYEIFANKAKTIIRVLDTQYGDKVILKFAFPKSEQGQIEKLLSSITQSEKKISLQGEQYFDYFNLEELKK